MRNNISRRIFNILGLLTLFVLILTTCYDELNIRDDQNSMQGTQDKATVSFSVNDRTARTVLPQVSIESVATYKLFGGIIGNTEIELHEFSKTQNNVILELSPGIYNFTLNAYNDNGVHILQSKFLNREISITDNNIINFSLSVINEGVGIVQVVLNFPEDAGITRIRISGDIGIENISSLSNNSFIYSKNNISAGDYFVNFEFYQDNLLRVIVSELILVRNNLTSSKTITLIGDDLKPVLTGSVNIVGNVLVGEVLTVNTSNLNGIGDVLYQWKRSDVNIGTYTSYIISTNDVGETINVTVTRDGYVGSITSLPTIIVPNMIPNVNDYTISGIGTFIFDGNNKAATITRKETASLGTVIIYYEGINATSYAKTTTAPTNIGTYSVTFDIASATGWDAVAGLFAGNIIIEPQTYSISLSETGTYTFPAAVAGYGTQNTRAVTINNIGNQITGSLTVTLSGINANSFTLSTTTINSIAVSGSIANAFTVRPNNSLTTGTYTAIVSVSGSNGIAAQFNISFTVNVATWSISLSETSTYTFTGATVGYGTQTSRTITVNNTGNQATGTLSLACSGTNASSFTLSPASNLNSIAVDSSSTFTVVPNTGLAAGTYTATITVSGSNSITAQFNVSFTIIQPAVTSININPLTATVIMGRTQQFNAIVNVIGNPSQAVTWTVTGGDSGTSISSNGLLTVGFEQRVTTLIVRATSVFDTSISSTATVTVVDFAQWAQAINRTGDSTFNSIATDTYGNIYAVGYLSTTLGRNLIVVKYNANGTVHWIQEVSGEGTWNSTFNSVAVDGSDNVYIAGVQEGNGIFTYGHGVTAQGSANRNAVVVKYNANGTALWVRTVSTGRSSNFNSVAVDASGNIYAAGIQDGTDIYTYGTGVTAQGSANRNAVVVKYNTNGTALWAQTVTGGGGYYQYSYFRSVAVDASGNVVTVGEQNGSGHIYGPGVITEGGSGYNAVMVKYNANGTALWARTVTGGGNAYSYFYSLAFDPSGNVFVAGGQRGNGIYTYGSNVTLQEYSAENGIIAKYDTNGTAIWAQAVAGSLSSSESGFFSIAVDSNGNAFTVGYQMGIGIFTYAPGVTAQSSGSSSRNVVLVKYDNNGKASWTRTISTGTSYSQFHAVAVDSLYNVYAAGYQTGSSIYTYGTGVFLQGSGDNNSRNSIIIKYSP